MMRGQWPNQLLELSTNLSVGPWSATAQTADSRDQAMLTSPAVKRGYACRSNFEIANLSLSTEQLENKLTLRSPSTWDVEPLPLVCTSSVGGYHVRTSSAHLDVGVTATGNGEIHGEHQP